MIFALIASSGGGDNHGDCCCGCSGLQNYGRMMIK
jgi:hypothetical protein